MHSSTYILVLNLRQLNITNHNLVTSWPILTIFAAFPLKIQFPAIVVCDILLYYSSYITLAVLVCLFRPAVELYYIHSSAKPIHVWKRKAHLPSNLNSSVVECWASMLKVLGSNPAKGGFFFNFFEHENILIN